MRTQPAPGTSAAEIVIDRMPAYLGQPQRWKARIAYYDQAGRIRHLHAIHTDPDAAADAVQDRLDELGIR
ncbi:hypothetical protein [Nocardia arizonensis]|uniref:hypothetical protein n=1 Tax=Nocardia arizonensis TaxID=1141647 RepID=UPI0006D00384|nr:hypothetical protein [Nocardia arizonensis]